MTFKTIAIIGAGNMGESLIGGLCQNGYPADLIWASDISAQKLQYLNETYRIHTVSDNTAAVSSADVVIFAVKPQIFKAVAMDIRDVIFKKRPLIISIAAGIRTAYIRRLLGDDIALVRAMPNMPACIGCGATAFYAIETVSVDERNLAESILRALGMVVALPDETALDAVTALSGSGPAYFFHMMASLENAAIALGLSSDVAHLLTIQTALGAARLALESNHSLDELRASVMSKGGTTEAAINVLEEEQISVIYKKAMLAARTRSQHLAEQLEE